MRLPSWLPPRNNSGSVTDRLEDGMLPLINVVFLLLMFFLISGLMMEDTLPPLPASAEEEGREEPRLDLVIAADGSLRIDGETVSADALAERLPSFDPDNRLRVGAHRDLSMSDLEDSFEALSDAGHEEVELLTDQAP